MRQTLESIRNASGLLILKDRDSVHCGTSMEMTNLFDWRDIDETIGKTDYGLPCKASEFARVLGCMIKP